MCSAMSCSFFVGVEKIMEKVDRSIRSLKIFDKLQRGAGLSSKNLCAWNGDTCQGV